MAWQLKPMGDRVVVKPKTRDETTKSGIVLPDTASERPQQGDVLSVGPGRVLDNGKRVQVDIKKGDTVLFAKYSGTEFKLDEEELLILSERDVLAVVENGKK
ncbi:MAG TPA: co-chaperone GroES [Chloroflexota bacterium]|nr:co-chaperone GroES [Chloroflexota bacterium]